MTTATLNISKIQKNIQSKVNSISMPEINWKSICLIGFLMLISLLLFYVWEVNNLAGANYSVKSYEKELSKLSNENKALQISFAESNFMNYAMEKMDELNFQKVFSLKYVQVPQHAIVSKK